MMPSRSTPNLQQSSTKTNHPSIYSYLQNQSGLNFAPVSTTSSTRDADSPPAPPVRDSSSLKSIKYGPGHEKFPSWPVPAAAEAPQAVRGPPGGGSHRSKSWTDHTNYPKEKVVQYTRPYMKRQHSSYAQQVGLEFCLIVCSDGFMFFTMEISHSFLHQSLLRARFMSAANEQIMVHYCWIIS